MTDPSNAFPLAAWVTRGAAVVCATATLVAATPLLPELTGEAPVPDSGTAGSARSGRDRARVMAHQYLRQIQELRRAELEGTLDPPGQALLAALTSTRDAILAPLIQADHEPERREMASMRSRLDDIGAALAAHGRAQKRHSRRARV